MLRNTESTQKQSSTVWKLIAGLMAVMMVSGGFAGAVAAQETVEHEITITTDWNTNTVVVEAVEDGEIDAVISNGEGDELATIEEPDAVTGDTFTVEVGDEDEYVVEQYHATDVDAHAAYMEAVSVSDDDEVLSAYVEFAALDDGADPVDSTVTVEAFDNETDELEQVDESVVTIDSENETTEHEVDIGDEFTGDNYEEYIITVENGGDVVTADLTYSVLGGGGDSGSVTDGLDDDGVLGAIVISVFAGLIAIFIAQRI